MGPPDPRPSRTRRPARHAAGHGAAARFHDRPIGGGEEGLRRRQVLRSGDEGGARAAARDAARLRAEHRVAHPPLVRLLGPGDLTARAGEATVPWRATLTGQLATAV